MISGSHIEVEARLGLEQGLLVLPCMRVHLPPLPQAGSQPGEVFAGIKSKFAFLP